MIECSNEILLKKRRKRRKRIIALFLAFLIVFCTVFYFKKVVSNKIFSICEEYSKSYASICVNNAVLSLTRDDFSYYELIKIEKNDSGDIVLMSANSLKINFLTREIVEKTTKSLSKKLNNGVPIPLLTFLGLDLLKGYGKNINYKSVFVSQIDCEFYSDFMEMGLNQTLHKIYINVNCYITSYAFLGKKTQKISSPVLISETVLVGKIPEIYLTGKLFS